MLAYVYILESLRDGRYYIGSTIDLWARLKHHRQGHTHSTRRFGGVRLVFSEKCSSLENARKFERKLKKLKRKDFLEKIVKEGKLKR